MLRGQTAFLRRDREVEVLAEVRPLHGQVECSLHVLRQAEHAGGAPGEQDALHHAGILFGKLRMVVKDGVANLLETVVQHGLDGCGGLVGGGLLVGEPLRQQPAQVGIGLECVGLFDRALQRLANDLGEAVAAEGDGAGEDVVGAAHDGHVGMPGAHVQDGQGAIAGDHRRAALDEGAHQREGFDIEGDWVQAGAFESADAFLDGGARRRHEHGVLLRALGALDGAQDLEVYDILFSATDSELVRLRLHHFAQGRTRHGRHRHAPNGHGCGVVDGSNDSRSPHAPMAQQLLEGWFQRLGVGHGSIGDGSARRGDCGGAGYGPPALSGLNLDRLDAAGTQI